MYGCTMRPSTLRSVRVCSTWLRLTMLDLVSTFMAKMRPLSRLRTCITLPKEPLPTTLSSANSLSPTRGGGDGGAACAGCAGDEAP